MRLGQVVAIAKKNFLVKMHPNKLCNSAFEVVMPLAYAAFIFTFAGMLQETSSPGVSVFNASFLALPTCNEGEAVAFAPNSTGDVEFMDTVMASWANMSNMTQPPCSLAGYSSYSSMQSALLANNSLLRAKTPVALVLDLPANTYTMLLKSLDDLWPPVDFTSESAFTAYQQDTSGSSYESPWVYNGGAALQQLLDRSLVERQVHGAARQMAAIAGPYVTAAALPLPPFSSNYAGGSLMLYIMPFYFTYGITSIGFQTLRPMVVERERRLVEGMHMMGLTTLANAGGWYLTYAALHWAGPVVTTIVVAASGFVAESNLFFLFVTLLLHAAGTVTYLCMIVPLLRKQSLSELGFLALCLGPGVGLYYANAGLGFPLALFWPSCLVSTAAAPLGISLFVKAEIAGAGLTSIIDTSEGTPLLGVWAMQLFDVLLYAWLAWYLDQVVPAPTTTGEHKSWTFCLPRWCCSSLLPSAHPKPLAAADSNAGVSSVAKNDNLRASSSENGCEIDDIRGSVSSGGPAVVVSRLRKTYDGTPPVHAVEDLSFAMANGEVTGLLGQNGAGKTTAINVLCGLVRPSAGSATVFGHSVEDSIEAIRAVSGVCPQHDLLFEELSLKQHVDLYAGIKRISPAAAQAQVLTWLERLEMAHKLHTRPDKLSGGQRRKVSLLIALLGDPRFVLLDEPTAGMDPQSRRAVWDFVTASKAGRATLLTTHFMDEADALCSSIVVVSKGRLAACGSPSDLKARFAAGYHLTFSLTPSGEKAAARAARLLAYAQRHVPSATLDDASAEQASLTLPTGESAAFPTLFAALDNGPSELGVQSYGVSLPSMQEAFLSILDAQRGAGGYANTGDTSNQPLMRAEDVLPDETAPRPPGPGAQMAVVLSKLRMEYVSELHFQLPMQLIIAALVTLAFALGAMINQSAGTDPDEPTALAISPSPFSDLTDQPYPLPYLPPTGAFAQAVGGALAQQYDYSPAPSDAALGPYEAAYAALSESLPYDEGAYAAFALPLNGTASYTPSTLLYNSSYPNSLICYSALFNDALIDAALTALGAPALTLTRSAGPLPSEDTSNSSALGLTLQIAPLLMVFSMMFVVLNTASRLAAERFNNTKQLLLLSGLDVRLFWAGYVVFDLAVLILLIVVVGAIAASASGVLSPPAVGALMAAELLALPGVVMLAYMISLPFKRAEETTGFIVIAFMLFGLLPTMLLSFVTNEGLKLAMSVVLLLGPPNQIITAIIGVLTLEQQSVTAEADGGAAFGASDYFTITFSTSTYDLSSGQVKTGTALGPGLVCLVAATSSLLLTLAFYTLEVRKFRVPRATSLPPSPASTEEEDADVTAERDRVARLPPSECAVRVEGMTMEYLTAHSPLRRLVYALTGRGGGRKLRAVDNVTLAVPMGSCFALLGPNGAGKTSLIAALTGEHVPTAGQAALHGLEPTASLEEVFQQTGFCPQLKGLWESLTLRQHLQLLMRLRGLRGAALDAAVAAVERGYGLEEHAHKLAKRLSGGTQRKLSAAMALSCGRPKVVFVDEPTTGVDVGTRRFIWDRIKDASKECAVVLTTHYMDEADALAQRIGIMAAGKLRVLGSPQHLKSVHGGGYRVGLKAADASEETEAQLTALVERYFSGVARVPSGRGTLLFDVDQGFALAEVFGAFEAAKASLGLETFTMSQTSLEDVFLRVSAKFSPDATKQIGGSKTNGLSPPDGPPSSNVLPGVYSDPCRTVYVKFTPQEGTEPPAYEQQCLCCMFEWVVPIPCCCIKQQVHRVAPEDGDGDVETYAARGGKERHQWTEPGTVKVAGPLGKSTYIRRF